MLRISQDVIPCGRIGFDGFSILFSEAMPTAIVRILTPEGFVLRVELWNLSGPSASTKKMPRCE